ncbi:MAG TPA: fused MFS/spermidine synthase [Terriglobales bacterium]|nr:fused MFS/spermidine synthase [Terriglobales bacterium]
MRALEILYAATIGLSAFLLFQIQPIIAKMILPWFGGSSAVWSTCMLFFQVMLLAGYLYAHWLEGRFGERREALAHSALLAVSLLALPVIADPSWKPAPSDNPSLRILGLLGVTVGLPYFLLSTTSSLMQAWYSRTHEGAIPYRLFALSNFASMLALVTYPVMVEPLLATRVQAGLWSAAYVCFALLCGMTAWVGAQRNVPRKIVATTEEASSWPPAELRILWAALAACASTLLLAVTTFLTQDVAAIPFLWIVPLAVYLMSFILCFESTRFYYRRFYIPAAGLALGAMALRLAPFGWRAHMTVTIPVFTACLFVCCMVCHGELATRKPHARYLTGFYLMVALGGAAGGLFVGLVAPNLFDAYYEFPSGLAMCAAIVLLLPRPRAAAVWKAWRPARVVLLSGYVIFLGVVVRESVHNYRVVERNFYGQLRVRDDGDPSDEAFSRVLLHGVINHGQQMLNEKYRRQPVSYFCPASGIGQAMTAWPQGAPRRIGILGLGCGTLAAYGRAGDTFRIYEINPLVLTLANTEFSYLRDSQARIEVVPGDGRLSLEREPSQQFDLVIMDAFSGDSVPVHLITREAFETYFRHLKPGGLLAVNISNRYLDLRPVMERAASHFDKIAVYYDYKASEDDFLCFSSDWVLIADRSMRQSVSALVKGAEVLKPYSNFRMWTDDFSNMWGILR